MEYLYQIEGALRNNIGDVLQGMVAKPFLPNGSRVVDREDLASIDPRQESFLIANGWYMHSFERFPPPGNVKPLYIAVHVADSALLRDPMVREHFRANGPVGCRDHKTLKLFLGWGIPAYYSGCLTVTTEARAPINTAGSGECLLVDNVDHPVPEDVKRKLEELLGHELTRVSHDPPDTSGTLDEYDLKATAQMEALLERYCRARVVITTKIHCALPCLGMGANVVMIHPNPNDPRLDTVREFVDVLAYSELLDLESITRPAIHHRALESRQAFLCSVVGKAVDSATNPVATAPEFRRVRFRAQIFARIYRVAIHLALRLGFLNRRIQHVYG